MGVIRTASALVLGAMLVVALPAAADAQTARMRQLYERGANAFYHSRYEEAADLLRQSIEAQESDSARFMLGHAYRALGRLPEALTSYERALAIRRENGPISEAEIREAIARVREDVGTVTFEVAPPGARITVDDRLVGQAPLAGPVPLLAGRRTIAVSAEGHVTQLREIDVLAGEDQRVEIALLGRGEHAHLVISSLPEELSLAIDGLPRGGTPFSEPIDPGPHRLRFSREGYHSQEQDIVLAAGQRRRLHVELTEDTVWTSPVFWTIVGALLVGAGVGVGYYLWWDAQPWPGRGANEPGSRYLEGTPVVQSLTVRFPVP